MLRPAVDRESSEARVGSGVAPGTKFREATWAVLSLPRDCLRWAGSRLWSGLVFCFLWPYFLLRLAFRAWLRLLKRCLLRTTSVILLLGVGSFVCYKLYCQLRQRFRRRRKSKREAASLNRSYVENWISGIEQKGIQGCYVDSDNESDISDASLPDTSQASFGDIPKPVTEHAEAEKQCDGSSSCGGGGFLSDDEFLDMGVGSSNPYEPVRFDSHSGDVCFQGCPPPKASTPLNIAPKNQNNGGGGGGSFRLRNRKAKLDDSQPPRQSKQSQKDTSVKTGGGGGGRLGDFKASVKNNNNNDEDRAPLSDDSISQDPESLLDSLSYEGGGEASTPWANDSVSLLANFSIGSLSERNRRTEELISSRVDSQGEETDDFSLAGGMVSDSALLRLRSSHSRQLSADSEASDLSIFERAQAPLEVPCETFETIDKLETVLHDTKQELLDLDADLVSLRVFRKLPANYDVVLEDVNKKNIDALVHRGSVRDSDMHPDSGSDFGNSLESDSERLAKHSSGPSLEWDSLPISRCFSEQERQHESDSTDFGGFSEFSESEDGAEPQSVLGVVRRHSSGNIHNAGTLRQQIQRILYEESESWKRHLVRSQTLPVDQSLPEADRTLVPITREPVSLNKITTVPEENTPSPSSVSDFASLAASSDRDTSMDTNGNDLRDMLKDDGLLELESAESAELLACVEDKVSLADYIMGLRHKRRHQSGNGMEKSLAAVLSGLEVRSLRRIKNDGCAAIRAAGFQILASGGSILAGHRGANGVYQRFHDSASSPGAKPWLEGWAFHHSLRGVHTLQGFWECLSLLQDLEDQLRLTATPEALLARKLNADPLADAKFVEAIKILMLKSALELFAKQKDSDTPCPLFATVLFSQVTLTSPEEYLVNHISRLGRDRAIPEAELYLLGYALETTLTVVRPSCSGNEDIVSRYPEWQVGSWPEAVLLEHKGHLWACAT